MLGAAGLQFRGLLNETLVRFHTFATICLAHLTFPLAVHFIQSSLIFFFFGSPFGHIKFGTIPLIKHNINRSH